MQNALTGIIVGIGGLLFCVACRPNPPEPGTLCDASVTLETRHGWELTVQADGSGRLRYRQTTAHWPRRTFAFQRLRLLPAFAPRDQEEYPYRWTYRDDDKQDLRRYGLPDTAWGAAWFEQAYRSLDHEAVQPGQVRRLRKSWRHHPPPGVRPGE